MFKDSLRVRLFGSTILLFGVLVLALFGKNAGSPTPIYGSPSYSITMDASNAPTTSDSYVSATQTIRYTQFEYSRIKFDAGHHGILDADSFIVNSGSSLITSMTSITATFTSEGTFTVDTSYDGSNFIDYPLTSGVTQELPYLPYIASFYSGASPVTLESIVITYTCTPHAESLDKYIVQFFDEDGYTLLEKDRDVEPGTMPSYDGPIPTKAYDPEAGTFFSFAGWDIPLSPVTSNQTYYATYTPYMATYALINGGTAYELRSVSDNTLTSINIPSSYNGLPVTSIASEVFSGFTHLASVDLPSTLTTLGDAAFGGCTALTTIHFPASLVNLGFAPFASCSHLTSFTVDSANPDFASVDGVLFDQAGTTLVMYPMGRSGAYSIPSGVTALGDFAFLKSTKLTGVTIPESVTTIGTNAFVSCSSLNNVVIPDTVTSLGGATFVFCSSLTSVSLPSGLTALPYSIFQECTSLATVTLPSGITDIEMDAFYDCFSLSSVNIPSGVTQIGPRAFMSCMSLDNVTLPEGLLSIGGNAFTSCVSLTSISIPSSVTSIGELAFSECSSLTAINVHASNATYSSLNGVLFNFARTTLYCYPAGKTDTYYSIPSSVKTITANAFRSNSYLTSLVIPSAVSTIAGYGIYLCGNVTINCATSSQPAGWDASWNASARPVVWGYLS